MNDLRFALRQLRKAPAFTVTALATVAICLGANLAIFAVINSILLRPLPFPDPIGSSRSYNTYPKAGVENDGSSLTNYYERRGNIPAFSSLSIFRYGTKSSANPVRPSRKKSCASRPNFSRRLAWAWSWVAPSPKRKRHGGRQRSRHPDRRLLAPAP